MEKAKNILLRIMVRQINNS